MAHLSEVILKPLLTEKTSLLTEKRNVYCFQVRKESTKIDVKKAIEKFFDVKVKKVTTSILPGKQKRVGKGVKKTSSTKKAYVFVEEGQKIELFKGI